MLSQYSPGHNYILNTPAQIGLIAVIINGRLLTLPCDNKYLLLLASTDFFRAILCCWLSTSQVKLEIAQTPEFFVHTNFPDEHLSQNASYSNFQPLPASPAIQLGFFRIFIIQGI